MQLHILKIITLQSTNFKKIIGHSVVLSLCFFKTAYDGWNVNKISIL